MPYPRFPKPTLPDGSFVGQNLPTFGFLGNSALECLSSVIVLGGLPGMSAVRPLVERSASAGLGHVVYPSQMAATGVEGLSSRRPRKQQGGAARGRIANRRLDHDIWLWL